MGELETSAANMFNSLKNNTKEETAVLEKAPLLLDTRKPHDRYVSSYNNKSMLYNILVL